MKNTLVAYSSAFFEELAKGHSELSGDQEKDFYEFKIHTRHFCETGRKEDAFTVYFCYAEIFAPLGKGYANTKHIVELLSDHEHHAGELLTKHRDHYSHSAYVFAIGLAIYAADRTYREAFQRFYGLGGQDYVTFLRLWGLTSLFHDVGYPFELAHDQIRDYGDRMWGAKDGRAPFVSYGNMKVFDRLDADAVSVDAELKRACGSINGLLAYGVSRRMGYDRATVADTLSRYTSSQPRYMDHAYFSAALLARQIFDKNPEGFTEGTLDALTAILLHNSFNKVKKSDLTGKVDLKPVARDGHPLAYLLILCDELQCWDRQAFGLSSRKDPLAWNAEFEVGDNEVEVTYLFESDQVEEPGGATHRNGNYGKICGTEQETEIMGYVQSDLKLVTVARTEGKDRQTYHYASEDNFVNLCDFAESIHENYCNHEKEKNADYECTPFADLKLFYKLSNVEQAKSYAYKLELVNCFYSHKELDYPVVSNFRRDNEDPYDGKVRDDLGFLSREEHIRWVQERLRSGWTYAGKTDRDNRLHSDLVPYDVLLTEERKKDENAINGMIPLLYRHGNCIRIYRYRYGRKPNLEVGGTGHVYIDPANTEFYKTEIKNILKKFQEQYRVIVRTCFAPGADLLIAECAVELGITIKAILPMAYEEYVQYQKDHIEGFDAAEELRMRHLLAQTAVCRLPKEDYSDVHPWLAATKDLACKCDKLIVLWDEKEVPLEDENGNPINQGGTYHCMRLAMERRNKPLKHYSKNPDKTDIFVIHCDKTR